jgi:hypothetical protein
MENNLEPPDEEEGEDWCWVGNEHGYLVSPPSYRSVRASLSTAR